MKKTTLSTLLPLLIVACSGGRDAADAPAAPVAAATARTTEPGRALTRRDVMIARTEAANTARLRAAMGLPVAKMAEAPTPDRISAEALRRTGRTVDLSDPFIPGVDDAPTGVRK